MVSIQEHLHSALFARDRGISYLNGNAMMNVMTGTMLMKAEENVADVY